MHYIAISELGFSQYMHHWTKEIIQKRHFTSKIVTILYQVITIILNIITSILVFPLKLLEIISLLFSLTFRLFGNMFGGSIVISLLHKMQASGILYQLPITLFGIQVIVLLYFSLFEGMIQAFIFTLILLNTLGGFFNHDA